MVHVVITFLLFQGDMQLIRDSKYFVRWKSWFDVKTLSLSLLKHSIVTCIFALNCAA